MYEVCQRQIAIFKIVYSVHLDIKCVWLSVFNIQYAVYIRIYLGEHNIEIQWNSHQLPWITNLSPWPCTWLGLPTWSLWQVASKALASIRIRSWCRHYSVGEAQRGCAWARNAEKLMLQSECTENQGIKIYLALRQEFVVRQGRRVTWKFLRTWSKSIPFRIRKAGNMVCKALPSEISWELQLTSPACKSCPAARFAIQHTYN